MSEAKNNGNHFFKLYAHQTNSPANFGDHRPHCNWYAVCCLLFNQLIFVKFINDENYISSLKSAFLP